MQNPDHASHRPTSEFAEIAERATPDLLGQPKELFRRSPVSSALDAPLSCGTYVQGEEKALNVGRSGIEVAYERSGDPGAPPVHTIAAVPLLPFSERARAVP